MNLTEAAEVMGVTRQTLAWWEKQGIVQRANGSKEPLPKFSMNSLHSTEDKKFDLILKKLDLILKEMQKSH